MWSSIRLMSSGRVVGVMTFGSFWKKWREKKQLALMGVKMPTEPMKNEDWYERYVLVERKVVLLGQCLAVKTRENDRLKKTIKTLMEKNRQLETGNRQLF